jgi:hypothetical protein
LKVLTPLMLLPVWLLVAVPVAAQQLDPGVWFGIPSGQAGPIDDERFEVESQNGRTLIYWAPYGKKPVDWGAVALRPDGTIQFEWQRSPSGPCTLKRLAEGVYEGACGGSGEGGRKVTLTWRAPSHGAELGVSEADFRILSRARELLSRPSVWNRRDERACEDDLAANSWSLFCALYQASIDVAGKYLHRRPVLSEARAAVDELTKDEDFDHPLRDFNNSTTFASVQIVFERTRARLDARKVGGK